MTKLKSWQNNFNLNSISEVYFWKSQWERFDPTDYRTRVSLCFVFYRLLYMCYHIASFVGFFSCNIPQDELFLIYLTNQTFSLQVIYSMIYFVYVSVMWVKQRKVAKRVVPMMESENLQYRPLPFINKMLWIMINVLYALPYPVTFGYWIVLNNPSKLKKKSICYRIRNHLVHSLNSPASLIDSLVVSVPIRLTHFIFPFLAGLYYMLFSIAYEFSDAPYPNNNTAIYTLLDWKKKPSLAAAASLIGIIGSFLVHFAFCWGTFRLRVCLSKSCNVGPPATVTFPLPEIQSTASTISAIAHELDRLSPRMSVDSSICSQDTLVINPSNNLVRKNKWGRK